MIDIKDNIQDLYKQERVRRERERKRRENPMVRKYKKPIQRIQNSHNT